MVAVVSALAALWFLAGAITTVAAAVPAASNPAHPHRCEDLTLPAILVTASTQRGPPAIGYDYTAPLSAGDHESCGASARPWPAGGFTYTTYDHTARSGRGDNASATIQTASGGSEGAVHALSGANVAANAGVRALPAFPKALSGGPANVHVYYGVRDGNTSTSGSRTASGAARPSTLTASCPDQSQPIP